jgi:hypothetical protein
MVAVVLSVPAFKACKPVTITGAADNTVKLAALDFVPPALVTLMGPVVAPTGTAVVICVLELTVKFAEVLLNNTAVEPVNLFPVSVT